jgi:hypothetical protein
MRADDRRWALPGATMASTVTAGSPGAQTLIETVQEFWPNGTVVQSDDGAASPVATSWFAFVPNAAEARFLLPLHHRTSAGEALRKYSASLTLPEIAQRTLMSFAFRWGGTVMLRDRVGVSGDQESLRSYLSDVLGEEVTFSISLGTARVNRKPILQIFSAKGRTLAYAKVGDGAALADVQAEARALRRIHGRLPARLAVPEVLHTGTWRGAFILLLSPLRISMWQRPGGQMTVPTSEMLLLTEAFAEQDRGLEDSALWADLHRSLEALDDGPLRARLTTLLPLLAALAPDHPLRVGAWHGDWTSWNMARAHGRLMLWDWERFETGVLQGLDHCHFLVNARTRRYGFDSATILHALRDVQPVGQAADARAVTVGVYLARLALRYSLGAQGPTGSLIAGRAQSVVDALSLWMAELTPSKKGRLCSDG